MAAAAPRGKVEGGGVVVVDGDLTEVNVTHGADDAPFGGVVSLAGTSYGTLTNTIVYGAATGVGVSVDEDASFVGTYNDVYGNGGGEYEGVSDPTGADGNLSVDPSALKRSHPAVPAAVFPPRRSIP